MIVAVCDCCGVQRPARFVPESGGYIAPQFWFQHPTGHPSVMVLACSKQCAGKIDLNRAVRKAVHHATIQGDFGTGHRGT